MPQSVTGTGGRLIAAVPRRAAMTLALAVAVQGWLGCGGDNQAKVESSRDAAVVRPGHVPAASVEVTTARPRLDPPPRAGSVSVQAGPFSDRVRISRLAFTDAGARPRVRGRMVNRVDVSEVIVLEVKADFYDRDGRHVGSGSQVFENAEAFDHADEAIRFDIRPLRPAQGATSAVLSVPQLVNE
jgi:hypothetical protein